jgi:hypothetical protein
VKDKKKVTFDIEDFKELGVMLCNGLHCFLEFDISCEQKQADRLEGLMFHRCLAELKGDLNLVLLG